MISPEYAAGFFDGEGCVNFSTRGKSRTLFVRVFLTNTDEAILSAFQATFGGRLDKPRQLRKGWKPHRNLTLTMADAVSFLNIIRPHVLLKRGQIDLALEFWKWRRVPKAERCEIRHGRLWLLPAVREQEKAFAARMHALNLKGAA